jgi:hypothetical protein
MPTDVKEKIYFVTLVHREVKDKPVSVLNYYKVMKKYGEV